MATHIRLVKTVFLSFALMSGLNAQSTVPDLVVIPSGTFEMGDHSGLGGEDTKHPSDERPLHTVAIDSFYMGKYHVTNLQYCTYLNDAFVKNQIIVQNGIVFFPSNNDTLFKTFQSTKSSRISFNGTSFSVLSNRENHPVTNVRWTGAIAYCNWLSKLQSYQECYDIVKGVCDFSAKGYRLPTEAEWEYAAYGGKKDPYPIFPWGDDTTVYGAFANWEISGDPYEVVTDTPCTTPVGFYNGELHKKADFNWPGTAATYQTKNGINGFGLYDMSGNAWQYCNDWYLNPYYAKSPVNNPTGPSMDSASLMPDGKPYHCLRGGNWFNGATYYGHGRISNRNPSYFRGPGDPNGPWFHIGFRIVLKKDSLSTNISNTFVNRQNSKSVSNVIIKKNDKNSVALMINNTKIGTIHIDITDIAGKTVYSMTDTVRHPGTYSHTWNCRNSNGVLVAQGSYCARVSFNNEVPSTIVFTR